LVEFETGVPDLAAAPERNEKKKVDETGSQYSANSPQG
jgi:hypothetical protein